MTNGNALATYGNDLASDDPNNTSGLGSNAVAFGCVFLCECVGLTTLPPNSTTTLSTAVQTANATVIQNAINYAATNGKIFVVAGLQYQFYSSTGLQIPIQSAPAYGGFSWLGAPNAQFIQYYATSPGAPVITIGDPTYASLSFNIRIDGGQFYYGVAQTGFTNAKTMIVGGMTGSSINNIILGGASNSNPGYYGCYFPSGSGGCFSCSFENWAIRAAQYSLLYIGLISTGCIWKNIYMSIPYASIAGPAFYMYGGNEQHFDQINIEGVNTNQLISIATNQGAIFQNVHIERCNMTGSNPIIWALQNSAIAVNELTMVDCYCGSAFGTSGTASIFNNYTPSDGAITKIGTVVIILNGPNELSQNLLLFSPAGLPSSNVNVLSCEAVYLQDYGGTTQLLQYFEFDPHMPVSTTSFLPPKTCGRYTYGKGGSSVEKAVIPVSSTYTHYGQLWDSTIVVPASITSFTITLAATQGITGSQLVKIGNTVNIYRNSGTAAGTLTVVDDAGTNLTTSTTAGVDYWYVFNGTHYVAMTPVT